MTAYNTSLYASKQPAATGHGEYQVQTHLHAVSPALPTSLATGDTINMGYIPAGAVVTGLTLKAPTQLDSSTGLVFDVGDAGSANRYMAGTILVGRAAGASFDTTMAAGGKLYKNTTGAAVAIVVKVNTQATTAVAGTIELEMSYFVEDVVGSAP
jgi:hypothetical protein